MGAALEWQAGESPITECGATPLVFARLVDEFLQL
jgi:hypothetical protein